MLPTEYSSYSTFLMHNYHEATASILQCILPFQLVHTGDALVRGLSKTYLLRALR